MADLETHEFVNEHILELRYKPNPQILDYRGRFVESFSSYMNLSEWRISNNRVDIHSKDELIRAFVSIKNAGLVLRNTDLPDYFPNQANKFIKHLFSTEPFNEPLLVRRLGVRSRFATISPIPFEKLIQECQRKVIKLNTEAANALEAELTDIAFHFNFETPLGKFYFNGGPMEKAQLEEFFDFVDPETLPETVLYVNLDYWLKSEEMSSRKIKSLVKEFAMENWTRNEKICSLVMDS